MAEQGDESRGTGPPPRTGGSRKDGGPTVRNGADGRPSGSLSAQAISDPAQQGHRPGPVRDSVRPRPRDAAPAYGCPGQCPRNRPYSIGVPSALQHGLNRATEVTIVPQPRVDGNGDRVVHVARHPVLQPQGGGELRKACIGFDFARSRRPACSTRVRLVADRVSACVTSSMRGRSASPCSTAHPAVRATARAPVIALGSVCVIRVEARTKFSMTSERHGSNRQGWHSASPARSPPRRRRCGLAASPGRA